MRYGRPSLFMALAIAGCGGSTSVELAGATASSAASTGSGETKSAKDDFLSIVWPELAACTTCHTEGVTCIAGAPSFLGLTAEASYDLLVNGGYVVTPENATLVLHGEHSGPALSSQANGDIDAWLRREVKERGLVDGATASSTMVRAFADFGACMKLDDFIGSSAYELGEPVSGQCVNCHTMGLAGTFIGGTSQEMFAKNARLPFMLRLVRGTVNADGSFADLVASSRYLDKADPVKEPCAMNPSPECACHPVQTLPATLSDGISQFVDTTLARWHAGACTAN